MILAAATLIEFVSTSEFIAGFICGVIAIITILVRLAIDEI